MAGVHRLFDLSLGLAHARHREGNRFAAQSQPQQARRLTWPSADAADGDDLAVTQPGPWRKRLAIGNRDLFVQIKAQRHDCRLMLGAHAPGDVAAVPWARRDDLKHARR